MRIIFVGIMILSPIAYGENPAQHTQSLLVDSNQRSQTTQNSNDAKKADDAVKQLVGSGAHSEEVYKLAAEVFDNIYKDSKGDPAKMKASMERFQKDPEAFAASWTPEQKAKLHELTEKINRGSTKPSN